MRFGMVAGVNWVYGSMLLGFGGLMGRYFQGFFGGGGRGVHGMLKREI